MDLRICERTEPSHIHIPRPSRLGREQQTHSGEVAAQAEMFVDETDCAQ